MASELHIGSGGRDLNPRPLGYEPYDVRLRRLGSSLVTALTSIDPRREVFPDLLRLPRLGLSRRVRFTNRFTELTTDLRFPEPFRPCPGRIRGPRHGVHARQATAIEPLRPELAAVLGRWPLSQLTEGAGDS